MGDEKKVYSFRLEPELVKELQRRARQENRTLSNLVETVLKQYALSEAEPERPPVGIS